MRNQPRLQSAMDYISDIFAIWNQAVRLQSFNTYFSYQYQNNEGPPQIGQTYQHAREEACKFSSIKIISSPYPNQFKSP